MSKCLFCQIVNGDIPSYKIYENDHVYAFLDIFPASKRHTLVIPKQHAINIYDIDEENLQHVIAAVRHIAHMYKEKFGIENVQILNNNGAIAQQEVFHLHYHVVPRFENDGQNRHRTTYPDMKEEFSSMLELL